VPVEAGARPIGLVASICCVAQRGRKCLSGSSSSSCL
jgi:hypothetical protein